MKTVLMKKEAGEFCENKDIAKRIREELLFPALRRNESVTFDFAGVVGATQSFMHALVSDALRRFPEVAFDNIFYKNAAPEVKQIISIVYTYMQQN